MYLHNPSGGLASHSMGVCVGAWGGGGWVEFWYSLVLLASPIKIIPNCAGLLACFKGLSHPCCTTIQSKEGEGVELLYFLLLHTSPVKVSSCFAGPLACFNYLSCSWGVDYHPIQKGEGGGGVGVVIITPWCFMLLHCFAGPLACFRSIVHLLECWKWNEPLSLLIPLDSRN